MSWPPNTMFVVVSAVQLPIGAYPETYTPVAVDVGAWLDELTKLHREVTSRGARKLADAGPHTQERVLQSDPREALIEEAKKERADLIVVGSHGRTGLEKLVIGSVATHVVTHAPCNVMVVRRGALDGRKQAA
jgi:nucleotide-binding universal stress UspA family protein